MHTGLWEQYQEGLGEQVGRAQCHSDERGAQGERPWEQQVEEEGEANEDLA